MGVNKKKVILMLDHEPMLIDRRIILEGKSLAREGYKVYLATRGDGIKPSVEMTHGIEVRRFCDSDDEQNEETLGNFAKCDAARAKIEQWISSGGHGGLEKKIRGSNPGLMNSVVYAIAWPPALAHVLRTRFPGAKKRLGRAFEPAVYSMTLRVDFLVPYFVLATNYLKNRPRKSVEHALKDENSWESKVFSDALKLRPDYVHAHDLPNLEMGFRIAEKTGAALIYDAHELYPLQYFSDESRRASLLELERRLIVHADAVITVNQQCVEVLKKEYGVENVIAVTNATEAPPGFDPQQRQRKWHDTFMLDDDVRIMVFQGGINPVRNVDPLVEALAQCEENIHIGFVTYRKDIPYYDELSKRLGISHRIHYVVEIPWDEVNDWLASADVGVMPYQVTNFNAQISSPNKLYEFVVAGLPIMASTELVNVRKAVEEDGLGVVTLLRDVDSYVRLIKEMFDHPDGPQRFRANVIAARPRYLWSAEAPKVIDCYARLEGGRPSRDIKKDLDKSCAA